VRFVFSPPADQAAGLLSLPWTEPLGEWRDERLVEIRQRGISRHVVRFVSDDGELYALKSISERLARREYRLLRLLAEVGVPAVEVVGVAIDLGPDTDAILVTRFLTFAITYRAVFSSPRGGGPPTDKLLDALVERCSTRFSSTGGTCPSGPAGTWEPPRPPAPTSSACSRRRPSR
jgi:hypothetical protein